MQISTFIKGICLILLFMAPQALIAQKKAKKLKNRAVDHIFYQEYDQAISVLDIAIKKAGVYTAAEYTYIKAMTYHVQNDTVNARKVYESLLKNPNATHIYSKVQGMLKVIDNEPENAKTVARIIRRQDSLKKVKEIKEQSADSLEVKELNIIEKEETDGAPFAIIERPPSFGACLNAADKRKCFNLEIRKVVNKHFDIGLAKDLSLVGNQRITSTFIINKKGNIEGIRVRASNPFLKLETKRVLQMVPKAIPGYYKGKPVNVTYALPIIFSVR